MILNIYDPNRNYALFESRPRISSLCHVLVSMHSSELRHGCEGLRQHICGDALRSSVAEVR